LYGTIALTPRFLDDYKPIVGEQVVEELRELARPLEGARVLHLNVTPFGTGVAETLSSVVPLMNDLGLRCEWQVIRTSEAFTQVNRAMYNALTGIYTPWSPEMGQVWLRYNEMNAALFDEDFDFVVVHDPQPAGILGSLMEKGKKPRGKWTWHCHLDLGEAQEEVWQLIRPLVEAHDCVAYDLEFYVRRDLAVEPCLVVCPAIDPLCTKNMEVSPEAMNAILTRHGIDPTRPLISQVSPFDVWHDPLGLIEVYEEVKRECAGLQLVLVATMTSEDRETRSYYHQVAQRADADPDLRVFSSLNEVGNVEVNVFQRASRAVVQKSLRKGFGVVVAEALWKGRPVIAGRTGGIPLQIIDGETGYLVDSTQECTQRLLHLLRHPEEAERMGRAGREHIRDRFLITRYVRDYLELFLRLGR
jgi:trehalose synthase